MAYGCFGVCVCVCVCIIKIILGSPEATKTKKKEAHSIGNYNWHITCMMSFNILLLILFIIYYLIWLNPSQQPHEFLYYFFLDL